MGDVELQLAAVGESEFVEGDDGAAVGSDLGEPDLGGGEGGGGEEEQQDERERHG